MWRNSQQGSHHASEPHARAIESLLHFVDGAVCVVVDKAADPPCTTSWDITAPCMEGMVGMVGMVGVGGIDLVNPRWTEDSGVIQRVCRAVGR